MGFTQTQSNIPMYQFTNYSVDNGLSHNFIISIFQDSDGFMWFGSLNGLDRFDGNHFKHFERNEKDSSAIIGDFVNFIYKDSYGITWIGTENGGLQIFNKEKENFKLIYEQDSSHLKRKFFANSITEDKNGNLWIGTFSGLKRFIRSSESYETFVHCKDDPNSLCNNNVLKVYCDSKNRIWIGTKKGLDILSTDRKTFQHVRLNGNRSTDFEVIEFLEDKNGIMWIGTFSNGLIKYNTQNNTYNVILLDPHDDYSNTVRKILKNDDGNLWIGGRNGLFIYNPSNDKIYHYTHDESFPLSIPHNSIFDMCKDKSGNIWFGTRYGVSQWKKQNQVFQYYHAETNNNNCLNSSSVFNFLESDSSIYIATESGGINILDAQNKFTYLKTPILNTNNIKCICKADNGDLWIGTFMGGINVYNPKRKTIKYYLKNQKLNTKNTICDDRINVIVKDYKNNMWVGTGSGLARYNKSKDNFIHYPQFTTRQINWIKELDNTIWFGTADTLFHVKITNDSLLLAKEMNVVTRTIYKDKNNLYWISSVGNGIIKYNEKDSSMINITTQNGLSSNLTFGIQEDADGNLWISTSNGLNRYDPATKKITIYYKEDGTQINQYNYNSFTKLKSGELLFGGNNGFIRFNPENLKHQHHKSKIQITDFALFGERLSLNNDSLSILKKSISYTDSIILNHNQNFFTIYFSLLNFKYYKRNKYKYKLIGIDKQWVEAKDLNHATYTNINPGTYLFKVQGSDGTKWNKEEEQIYVIIKPPFYKTTFFKALSIILCISLILLIIRWKSISNIRKSRKLQYLVDEKTQHLEKSRKEILEQNTEIEKQNNQLLKLSNQVQNQNKKLELQAIHLENMVKIRTSELESAKLKAEESDHLKSVFLANMSHEIRTPMNGILGFTDLLKDPEITGQELINFVDIIEESGKRMLNIINDLIDISKIESNQIDLQYEETNALEVLDYLHLFFKYEINNKNIDFIKYTVPENQTVIYKTDKTKLIQIISNLINNAIKYTNKGFIKIGFKIEENYIEWFVSDSGIGIKKSLHSKIFDRFIQGDTTFTKKYQGAGLGLYICKQYVDIMKGQIILNSELNKGTTFSIRFPLISGNKKLQ